MTFIKASERYNTLEEAVAAPYLRRSFCCDADTTAHIKVAACGFYELFLNGVRCTKGCLAPYISNTDDYIYYDEYDLPVDAGENVLGLWLGNGFQNNPGGYIWDFEKAPFRSAPMVAVTVTFTGADGNTVTIESDSSFKTAESPIRYDDYRFGECYDANFEIPGWNEKGFDDSAWSCAIETLPPRGELRCCTADPIVDACELRPVAITKDEDGYIYDFGIIHAGVCRLTVRGAAAGQRIVWQHAERLEEGAFDIKNVWFLRDFWERDKEIVHKDVYICKGGECESYTPLFTYHGFRYVKVCGITPAQATEELFTFVVRHSDLADRGGFSCSDPVVNTLQENTRRSDMSNFYYFPTDCPQREKNGWTADAALSAEQLTLNFAPEVSYREWLRNIVKAQDKRGALPGIIPTAGWGFYWGNGPAWDCVLAYLPYYTYIYRGETAMITEAAAAFMAYLHYLTTRREANGLLCFGLGDWCYIGDSNPKAPLALTDTVMAVDIAQKMAQMFRAVGMTAQHDFAVTLATEFRQAVRDNLIDWDTLTAAGACQSSQAMCLYYGIFTEEERPAAFERLLTFIREKEEHMDVGVLGGRVLFHVLSDFGYSDLAYHMITRPDYPSYGHWVSLGASTLWEDFRMGTQYSMNHHFWGDISAWFIKRLAGLQFNPTGDDVATLRIAPSFVKALDRAEGYYDAPAGRIVSAWKREGEHILLSLTIPQDVNATAVLENGYAFEDGTVEKTVTSGNYRITVTK